MACVRGRLVGRVVITLAAAAVLATGAATASRASTPAGATPAGASVTAPGWRITRVTTARLEGISPVSARDAWLVGSSSDFGSLYLSTWNGSTWRSATPPAGLGVNVYQAAVDAVSPTDVWLFPAVSGATSNVESARYWDGRTWATKFTFGATVSMLADVVFGPGNAWLFGQKTGTPGPSGWGQPYAVHYDGAKWQPSSLPITVLMTNKGPAGGFWAIGPSAKSTAYLALRWTGKGWTRPLAIPSPPKVNGDGWTVTSSVAQSPTSLWVLENQNVISRGTGYAPPGVALLHWNGSKWAVVTENLSYYLYDLTSDGGGGFWLAGARTRSAPEALAHYSGGRWAYQPVPTQAGYDAVVSSLDLIPGTRSLWALGSLSPVTSGLTKSVLLKYGP